MVVIDEVWDSLQSYFNTLTNLGYKSYKDTYKLIVYDFLLEMVTGDLRFYITEEDYRKIEFALYCLYGSSCLIPYSQYTQCNTYLGGNHINYLSGMLRPRISQVDDVRFSEDGSIRFEVN